MSTNPLYFVSEAATSFRRNWVMSLGAIITIFLSLVLIGTSLMASTVVGSLVSSVESKVSIQIFLSDNAATQDVELLQRELITNPMVSTVTFTSKDQALANFKKSMAKSPEVIANLPGNPLPASLDVQLKDPRNVETVVAAIKKSATFPKVAEKPENPDDSLKYGEGVVKKLFAFTQTLRYVGVVFVIMLAGVSLIFINNTIRLAIYARRMEISIMRLVGASNWFIRAPFMLEGIMQALVGAGLALVVLLGMYWFGLPRIQEVVSFMDFSISSATIAQISAILVGAGVTIGAFGSWIAMRKYLKI